LQETAFLEIRNWESRLRQSIQHLDLLLAQVSASLDDSQLIVAQRGEAIRTNSAVYNRLQQLMELINHSVEELARAAIQIEQVVGSISEVAEETNLLALNASIEAAGHLEQGRRFTVVAAEVYRLAVRSRDAAEEVRQVANQVQGSVTSLAEVSSQGRDQAYTLAQSARSAPLLVDQLSALMDNLGQTGKGIFEIIQDLQTSLSALLEGLPPVAARSEELGRSNRRLLNYILAIKQALVNLSEPDRSPPDPAPAKNRLAARLPGPPFPTDESQPAPAFYHKLQKGWLKGIFPSRYLLMARRRQSRLLNGLCLSFCLFLGGYAVFLLLTGFEIGSFLPVALFLVLILLAYSFSKTGFHEFALVFFFGSNYIFYTILLISQKNQFDRVDCIRVSSALFCITIMVAVIVADLRWVVGITLVSLAVTITLAYAFIERSFDEIAYLLAFPLAAQVSVGLLAGFLYYNINRLSARLESQNRAIGLENRRLQLKQRRIFLIARQLSQLNQEIDRLIENQVALSGYQLASLTVIVAKIEILEQHTVTASGSIRQLSQLVSNALEQVQQVVRETGEGSSIIEAFRGGVGEIARNSQDLKAHAGEIGQIFELITAVAEEIDLLALNATLEAAQARDSGKRFGAVAGEIQRLAGRARQTGTRVQDVVFTVQEAVTLCTQLTGRGHNEIILLTQSAYDTTFSVKAIVEVVEAGQKLIGQLEAAAGEQIQSLHRLNRYLQEISAATGTIQDQSKANFETIRSLQALAQSLSEPDRFPVKVSPSPVNPLLPPL
jgi:methyl-accepting chemotaxis protein